MESVKRETSATWCDEMSLIGSLVLKPEFVPEASRLLIPEDFWYSKIKIIYESILRVQGKGEAGSVVDLWSDIKERGFGGNVSQDDLLDAINGTPNANAWEDYARRIRHRSRMRKLRTSCVEIVKKIDTCEKLSNVDVGEFCSQVIGVAQNCGPGEDVRELSKMLPEMDLERKFNPIDGYPKTGLPRLDQESELFLPGALTVLAARPAMGKTSFMRQLVSENAKTHRCLVFTLEESKDMFRDKMVCSEAGVPYLNWLRGMVSADERVKMIMAMGPIGALQVDLCDEVQDANGICMTVRRMFAMGKGPRIVFVDHLQHMSHTRQKGESESSAIGRSVKELSDLAKFMKTTVVLLAQLNRDAEDRGSPRPQLAHLRDTGQLEQLASNVVFIWAEDKDKKERFLYVAKQRNGPMLEACAYFNGETGRFAEMTRRTE